MQPSSLRFFTQVLTTAVATSTEPFRCLLTTQYLSSSLWISSETKRWQRNARQSFRTFLGGLRKSSAVLNLILSVQLTTKGDSVRGFISAVDLLSVGFFFKSRRKEGATGSSHSDRNSLSVWQKKNINSCLILVHGVIKRHSAPAAYSM